MAVAIGQSGLLLANSTLIEGTDWPTRGSEVRGPGAGKREAACTSTERVAKAAVSGTFYSPQVPFLLFARTATVQAVQLNWAGSYRLVAFGTFWGGTIEKERGRRARSFIWGREQAEETGRKKVPERYGVVLAKNGLELIRKIEKRFRRRGTERGEKIGKLLRSSFICAWASVSIGTFFLYSASGRCRHSLSLFLLQTNPALFFLTFFLRSGLSSSFSYF